LTSPFQPGDDYACVCSLIPGLPRIHPLSFWSVFPLWFSALWPACLDDYKLCNPWPIL